MFFSLKKGNLKEEEIKKFSNLNCFDSNGHSKKRDQRGIEESGGTSKRWILFQ